MDPPPLRVPTRLEAVLGYLRHPSVYPELLRLAGRRLFRRTDRGALRRQGEAWCRERAIPTEAVLARMGVRWDGRFTRRQADVLAQLRPATLACPFPMGAADLDLLHAVAERLGATRAVETGVAHGWSSLALLMSLSGRPGSHLVSTDMLMPHPRARDFSGCVVPPELRSGWTLLQSPDREALPRALAMLPAPDLCHYDSDKSEEGRRWAYPLLWAALRPGGVFISDDVGDNLAFRDFARSTGTEPIVAASGPPGAVKHVGILVKPGGAPLLP